MKDQFNKSTGDSAFQGGRLPEPKRVWGKHLDTILTFLKEATAEQLKEFPILRGFVATAQKLSTDEASKKQRELLERLLREGEDAREDTELLREVSKLTVWLLLQHGEAEAARHDELVERLNRIDTRLPHKELPALHDVEALLGRLGPDDFSAELELLLRDFYGREWLERDFENWLSSADQQRVMLITGYPGIGKSAIAAWLYKRRPEVAAIHLCRFDHRARLDAARCFGNLARQLAAKMPPYGEQLLGQAERLAKLESADGTEVFETLLCRAAATTAEPDRPVVLIVDALDEATVDGRNRIADIIAGWFGQTPAWLRLVVTARPEGDLARRLAHMQPYVVRVDDPRNQEDVRGFLERVLVTPTLTADQREEAVKALLDRAGGLFLYARWAVDEIAAGNLNPRKPDEFPRGLKGVYFRYFERQFPDRQHYENDALPLIEVVCAAREPLETELLQEVLGWNPHQVHQTLEDLGSLFPLPDGRVRPWHKSVVEWVSNSQDSGRYWVNLSVGHARHADATIRALRKVEEGYRPGDPVDMSGYFLRHGPAHLASARLWGALGRTLTSLPFIEAKTLAESVWHLVKDYNLADRSAPSEEALGDDYAQWRQFVRTEAHNLCAHSRQFPPFVFQQAANQPRNGMVSQRAQELLASGRGPAGSWIERVNRADNFTRLACQSVLVGHEGSVTNVAVTADGRAVSASSDCTLRVWDLATGECLRTLIGHDKEINQVAVTADGRAVSTSGDSNLRVWDLATGECLRTLVGHNKKFTYFALTPDGHAMSASWDNTLRLWDLATGECLRTLVGPRPGRRKSYEHRWSHRYGYKRTITHFALTADGRAVFSGLRDKALRVWDLATEKRLRTLVGHESGVHHVALTADGRAVSASDDKTLRVWDLATGECLRTLVGHEWNVNHVAVTVDGRAVSASDDKTLRVWDLANGECLRTLVGHEWHVNHVAVTVDGRAVSASDDKTLRVWDLAAGECAPLLGHDDQVYQVVTTADRRAVSVHGDNTLRVWDLATGNRLRTLVGHKDWIKHVAVTTDGRAVSASVDCTLRVWDLATGESLQTLVGHEGWVNHVSVTADGRAVSASNDKTLRVWNLATGECLRRLIGHDGRVNGVAVTADGRAVSASDDKTLRVWDLANGECLRTLVGHEDHVTRVAVMTDGRAASASADYTLGVWDLATGDCLGISVDNHEAASCLELSGGDDINNEWWLRDIGLVVPADDRSSPLAIYPGSFRPVAVPAVWTSSKTPPCIAFALDQPHVLKLHRSA